VEEILSNEEIDALLDMFRSEASEIEAGEEIFIDYGKDYWQHHDGYPSIDDAPSRSLRTPE